MFSFISKIIFVKPLFSIICKIMFVKPLFSLISKMILNMWPLFGPDVQIEITNIVVLLLLLFIIRARGSP